MFEAEIAAKAAVAALRELVPTIVRLVQDDNQKAEDRLHAVHVLISIAQIGE